MINESSRNVQFNYKTRMVDELITLVEKITLLSKVVYSEDSAISKERLELMNKQLDCMYGYRAILTDRIYMELQ